MKYEIHSLFGNQKVIEAKSPEEAAKKFNKQTFPKEFEMKVNSVLIRNSQKNVVYDVSFKFENEIKHAWLSVSNV